MEGGKSGELNVGSTELGDQTGSGSSRLMDVVGWCGQACGLGIKTRLHCRKMCSCMFMRMIVWSGVGLMGDLVLRPLVRGPGVGLLGRHDGAPVLN